MPQVLLVGDLHGSPDALVEAFQMAYEHRVQAIIQLGDYGYGWRLDGNGECSFAELTSEMALEASIPFYFIDGNHENFDLLETKPVGSDGLRLVAWMVWHIPRGATLKVGETTFLALGGAYSVDKPHRTLGVSWWPQEMITQDDVDKAILAGPADVLLTHDVPYGIQDDLELISRLNSMFGIGAAERSLDNQRLISKVLASCGAQRVFHGHLHRAYDAQLGEVAVTGLEKERNPGSKALLRV